MVISLIAVAVLVMPLAALIVSIVALARSRRIRVLTRRVAELEVRLGLPTSTVGSTVGVTPSEPVIADEITAGVTSEEVPVDEASSPFSPQRPPAVPAVPAVPSPTASSRATGEFESRQGLSWEAFIGQKAFGWMAVLLFVFAVAFFLRYAYQNNWIGPVGRVAIGEFVGAALIVLGCYYHRQAWVRFSHMLTTAGIVAVYLATYSAFGFYRLLPQRHASLFLAVLVIESMVAAVMYRSQVVALVAVLGGLITPVLMQTTHDDYPVFFTYLAVLNLGVIVALALRSWSIVGSVAYAGTQWLFWSWYVGNYHPEKLSWALGFQVALFTLYLAHTVIAAWAGTRAVNSAGSPAAAAWVEWEELARCVVNASLGFAAYYVLTADDYRPWLGSVAIATATLYAMVGRWVLAWRPQDDRLLLTMLAISIGFVAWTFPIQADAHWVSLGWAAMGGALYWFGQRVSASLLRTMAAVLGLLAVGRLLALELPLHTRDPFVPLFNQFALPSLGVVACILGTVFATRRFLDLRTSAERSLVTAASAAGLLLLWLILSFDCYGYFDSQSIGTSDVTVWRWRGQLALTVLWTAYASTLLLLGFRWRVSQLRWLAIALFVVTVAKLFLVDMANVQQLYRILAFFVLAVVLAFVARTYQRFR